MNDQDHVGTKALNEGIENSSHDCISLLLTNGADLSIADLNGEKTLHVLARPANMQTIEIFQAADLQDIDPATIHADLTLWDLLKQRVDCTENLEAAFRSLMAKLIPRTVPVEYFDAMHKFTPMPSKVPDLIEVRIEELSVEG